MHGAARGKVKQCWDCCCVVNVGGWVVWDKLKWNVGDAVSNCGCSRWRLNNRGEDSGRTKVAFDEDLFSKFILRAAMGERG